MLGYPTRLREWSLDRKLTASEATGFDDAAYIIPKFKAGADLRGHRPGGELWAYHEMGRSNGYNVSTNSPVWPDVFRWRTERLQAGAALRDAWRRGYSRALC